MTQGNKTAVESDAANSNTSAALSSALIATHEALLLTEAVRQIDQALFWAQQGRSDLVTVFTSMAKLMLLEGNGSGSESEYWIDTTRSAIAIELQNPRHAVDCSSKALALAEVIFAQDVVPLGVARGNLGRALAFSGGQAEEARKLLSQGIFALAGVSHKLAASSSANARLQKYYSDTFIEFTRAIQSLPPRPR